MSTNLDLIPEKVKAKIPQEDNASPSASQEYSFFDTPELAPEGAEDTYFSSSVASFASAVELRALEVERKSLENEKQRLLLQDQINNIGLRKNYGYIILIGTGLWLISIISIILFTGFGKSLCFLSFDICSFPNVFILNSTTKPWFEMSDQALMWLMGTTTANVIAVILGVIKFLFPSNKSATETTSS